MAASARHCMLGRCPTSRSTGPLARIRSLAAAHRGVGQTISAIHGEDDSEGPIQFSGSCRTDYGRGMGVSQTLIRRAVAGAVLLFAAPLTVDAQPVGKTVPRIGYLDGASLSPNSVRIEAFRRGLRELGYVEGQNIAIEWRSAEGEANRLPGLAAELVRLKVAAIVTGGAGATRPAKEATATIPIVMAQDSDPVESGFVTSLARPGGNVTGLSTLHPEISGKRLELLKEVLPKLSRVAFFGTSTWAGNAQGLRETELAARALGLKLQYIDVSRPKDFEMAFQAAG